MKPRVARIPVPDGSLMAQFRDMPGCQADAYQGQVTGPVTLGDHIAVFFDTPPFRLERLLLRVFAGRATSAADVAALADGRAARFAIWQVVDRTETEIMLAVDRSRIRTWLAVVPPPAGVDQPTMLQFGSAVLPISVSADGKGRIGFLFRALTGFHDLYSRLLLRAAISKLTGGRGR